MFSAGLSGDSHWLSWRLEKSRRRRKGGISTMISQPLSQEIVGFVLTKEQKMYVDLSVSDTSDN